MPDPALDAFAQAATRLNPSPGAPAAADSHIGGPLLWPANEAWPACDSQHMVAVETPVPPELAQRLTDKDADSAARVAAISDVSARTPGRFAGTMVRSEGMFALSYISRRPETPNPLVPVAQLRAEAFPGLPFPSHADLLQVLWCPNDHAQAGWAPKVHLTWRSSGEVVDVLAEPPQPHTVEADGYVPRPCVLKPEAVVDYPWWQELPAELGQQVRGRQDELIASGWKAGGCASWPTTDLLPMDCPSCDEPMTLLLTISSDEETGVQVGRSGSLRIFVCTACPDMPHLTDVQ